MLACGLLGGCFHSSDDDDDGPGGATTFAKSYGGIARDSAASAIPRRGGGFAFAGTYNERNKFVERLGRGEPGSGYAGDVWFVLLDANGNVELERRYGRDGLTGGGDLVEYNFGSFRLDGLGNMWFAGTLKTFDRSTSFYTEPARLLAVHKGTYDPVSNSFSPTLGGIKTFDVPAYPNFPLAFADGEVSLEGQDIWPTGDGGALVTARLEATVLIDNQHVRIVAAYLVLKVDSAGNEIWRRLLTADQFSLSMGYAHVREAAAGGAYVAYRFWRNREVYTRAVRLDGGGVAIWSQELKDRELEDIHATSDGNLLLTGLKRNALGSNGGLVEKLADSDGRTLWRTGESNHYNYSVAERCDAVEGCKYAVLGIDTSTSEFVVSTLDQSGSGIDSHRIALAVRHYQRLFYRPGIDRFHLLGKIAGETTLIELPASDGNLDQTVNTVTLPGFHVRNAIADNDTGVLELIHLEDEGPDGVAFARWTNTGTASPRVILTPHHQRFAEGAHRLLAIPADNGRSDMAYVIAAERLTDTEDSVLRGAWLLRVDPAGDIQWQKHYRDFFFPPQNRNAKRFSLLERSADGHLLLAGEDAAYARLLKIDVDSGDILASLTPFTPDQTHSIQAIGQTANGDYVTLGYPLDNLNERGVEIFTGRTSFVSRMTAAGADVWQARIANVRLTALQVLDDDSLVLAGVDSNLQPLVILMDSTGTVQWSRSYPFGQSFALGQVHLAAARDGGYLLASTNSLAIQSDRPVLCAVPDLSCYSDYVAEQYRGYGYDNILLTKISGNGDFEWSQAYGGAFNETVHQVTALDDGGFLVAGDSESVGDRSDAWILRVGPDGRIARGCNAYLGRGGIVPRDLTVDAIAFVPLNQPVDDAVVTVVDTPELPRPVTDDVVARQCLGSASNSPGNIPNAVTLGVNQVGGSGVVYSTPSGILCGTAGGGVCVSEFAPGTLVTLEVELGSIQDFDQWGPGCDTVAGNFSEICIVTVDGDTTVDALFTNGAPAADLTVTIAGGSGEVQLYVDEVVDTGFQCDTSPSSPNPCVYDVPAGTGTIRLQAIPFVGSVGGWTGCDSADPPHCLISDFSFPRNATVTFE